MPSVADCPKLVDANIPMALRHVQTSVSNFGHEQKPQKVSSEITLHKREPECAETDSSWCPKNITIFFASNPSGPSFPVPKCPKHPSIICWML